MSKYLRVHKLYYCLKKTKSLKLRWNYFLTMKGACQTLDFENLWLIRRESLWSNASWGSLGVCRFEEWTIALLTNHSLFYKASTKESFCRMCFFFPKSFYKAVVYVSKAFPRISTPFLECYVAFWFLSWNTLSKRCTLLGYDVGKQTFITAECLCYISSHFEST